MSAIEKISIKKIETKILNGRKINVKVILEVETKVYSNDDISLISNINNLSDIQMLNSTKKVNSLLGKGNTSVSAKDTIGINEEDEIAEIMRVTTKIVNKDTKISYNKILAKADLGVSIMYLTEDGRIKNASCLIPIMGFIDMENISEENVCDLEYSIKNLVIKPNNMDSHSIYVEAIIEIECFAYEEKDINLIEDLYSICEDLSYKQKEITSMSNKCKLKDVCRINETVQVPEMENGKLLSTNAVPIISNETLRNGKVIYEGEISLEFIYESMNNIESRSVSIPFNFEIMSQNLDTNCNINTSIDVLSDNYLTNGSNIDIKIELEFNVSSAKNENVNIIDEIETNKCSDANIYSMVIYFVKPGDTLWKIAKKFRTTIQDIASINNIEDVNKLKTGQQLYIPKFVKKEVAV